MAGSGVEFGDGDTAMSKRNFLILIWSLAVMMIGYGLYHDGHRWIGTILILLGSFGATIGPML